MFYWGMRGMFIFEVRGIPVAITQAPGPRPNHVLCNPNSAKTQAVSLHNGLCNVCGGQFRKAVSCGVFI